MIATLILALHLLGLISQPDMVTFLYITGALLLIGEIFATTFGVVALNGLIALFIAYAAQSGDNMILGVPVDWGVLFGVAFIELVILIASIVIILHYRRKKVTTGVESLIGEQASVVDWQETKGRVRVQGETWKAESDTPLTLAADDKVTIESIENLIIKVKP